MSIDKNTWSEQPENNSDNLEEKKLSENEIQNFLEQQKTRESAEKKWVNKQTWEQIIWLDTKLKLTSLKDTIPSKTNIEQNNPVDIKSTDYISKFQQKWDFVYEYRPQYQDLIASAHNAPENQNSLHAVNQSLKYLANTCKDIGVNFIKDACKISDYKKLPKYILDNA